MMKKMQLLLLNWEKNLGRMKILLFLLNDERTRQDAVRTCQETVRDLLENGKGTCWNAVKSANAKGRRRWPPLVRLYYSTSIL
jgi:hypothetical protein